MVAQLCEYTKKHWPAYFERVNFMWIYFNEKLNKVTHPVCKYICVNILLLLNALQNLGDRADPGSHLVNPPPGTKVASTIFWVLFSPGWLGDKVQLDDPRKKKQTLVPIWNKSMSDLISGLPLALSPNLYQNTPPLKPSSVSGHPDKLVFPEVQIWEFSMFTDSLNSPTDGNNSKPAGHDTCIAWALSPCLPPFYHVNNEPPYF